MEFLVSEGQSVEIIHFYSILDFRYLLGHAVGSVVPGMRCTGAAGELSV